MNNLSLRIVQKPIKKRNIKLLRFFGVVPRPQSPHGRSRPNPEDVLNKGN